MPHDNALTRSNQPASRSVAGNSSSKGISMPAVVQREVVPQGTELDKDVLAALKEIDKLVQKAYLYLCDNPAIPQYVSLDGYTSYWLKLLTSEQEAYKKSEETEFSKSLLCAAAGYVIESIVSTELGASVNGYGVAVQVTKGNTRPDIILNDKDGKEVAWADITSTGGEGHVKGKAGNWGGKPSAEITYKSFSDEMLIKFLKSDLKSIGVLTEMQSGEMIPPHKLYAHTHTEVKVRELLDNEKSKQISEFLSSLDTGMPDKQPETLRMKYVRKAWMDKYNYEDISPKEIISIMMVANWHNKEYLNSKVKTATQQLGWIIINQAIEDEEINIDKESIKKEKLTEAFNVFGTDIKSSQTPVGKGKTKKLKEKPRQSLGGDPHNKTDVSADDTADLLANMTIKTEENK